jgi:hypothetical protein
MIDMQSQRGSIFFGYVKVEPRSRSPKLWGWEIRRSGSDAVVQRSDTLHRFAEDAWREGQRLLDSLEAEHPARPAGLARAA